jgi:hypothetical protein
MTRLHKTSSILIYSFLLIVVLSGGCGRKASVDTGDVGATSAALTVQAFNLQSTLVAQSALLTAQAGGATKPVESQATQPPPQQSIPGLPTISASSNTNCRTGPGKDYPEVGYLLVGELSTVQGKDASSNWWYIENPKKPGEYCWVLEATTKVNGDTSQVPIVEAPPLPQIPPEESEEPPLGNQPAVLAAVVNYLEIYVCGSTSFAVFEVVNNGNVDLNSVKIILQEQGTHQLISEKKNTTPFKPTKGCDSGGRAPLKGGASAYLVAELGSQFLPVGWEVEATFTLYTEPYWKGETIEMLVPFIVK